MARATSLLNPTPPPPEAPRPPKPTEGPGWKEYSGPPPQRPTLEQLQPPVAPPSQAKPPAPQPAPGPTYSKRTTNIRMTEPPQIHKGPPPVRKIGGHRRPGLLVRTIQDMQPGDWFYLPKYANPISAVKSASKRTGKAVECYLTVAGAYVCRMPDPKDPKGGKP